MTSHRFRFTKMALGIGAFCASLLSSQTVMAWNPSAHQRHPELVVSGFVPGEVLVKFKEKTSSKDIDAVERGADVAKSTRFKSNDNRMKRWRHLKAKEGQSTESMIAALKKNPHVEWVEPNFVVTVQQTPNDPSFAEQWALHNTGQSSGTADADIDAPEAWDVHRASSMVVAVIDTGVDYTHEDLADNMWRNPGEIPGNGIDDDANGWVDDVYGKDFVNNDSDPKDDHGHGTHVAGSIGAIGNNGIGVAGVNWSVKIMAVKFLSSSGSGTITGAVNAINYATQMGAKISNNSWGTTGSSQALYDAINAANNAGALFVAAAGNAGEDSDQTPHYPAAFPLPNIISVAATDHNDARASWSNYGATSVDLGAPGVNILSLGISPINGYKVASGTSMATPHVAGAAALIWGSAPALTAAQVKARLLDTVDPIASMAGVTVSGGRLNIHNAMVATYAVPSVTPEMQQVMHGNSAVYTLSFESGFSQNVTLQLAPGTLDPGLSASLADSTLLLPANGSASTTLTVQTAFGTPRGSHPVPVVVQDSTGGTFTVTPIIDVITPAAEFSIQQYSVGSKLVVRGSSKQFPITVKSVDDYAGSASLSVSVSDPTMTATISPASVNLTSGGSVNATVTVTSTSSTPVGEHPVTVSANAAGVERTGTVIADVEVVTVCPSGCQFSTITAATNAPTSVIPLWSNIYVGPGTYHESFYTAFKNVVSVAGPGETIVDATGLNKRAVEIAAYTLVEGLTIKGGNSQWGVGGGVFLMNNSTLRNSIVTENVASDKGGGVLFMSYSEYARLENNIIEGNSAPYGGAIAITGGPVTLDGNIIRNNTSTHGAVWMSTYQWPSGGGYSNAKLTNNLLTGNTGTAAIRISPYAVNTVANCTITGNSAGIYYDNYAGGTLVNSIVWGNTSGDVTGSGYGVPSISYSILGAPASGTGNIVANPLFVGGGDYRLQAGSPGIDSGKNTSSDGVINDIDGISRPLDGDGVGAGSTGDGSDYDIGAYEHQYLPLGTL